MVDVDRARPCSSCVSTSAAPIVAFPANPAASSPAHIVARCDIERSEGELDTDLAHDTYIATAHRVDPS